MIKPVLAATLALAAVLAPPPALALPPTGEGVGALFTPPAALVREAREPTAGQISARDRQKRCGAEWKEAKAANKVPAGQKWPQFWSACNKRLKGGTA